MNVNYIVNFFLKLSLIWLLLTIDIDFCAKNGVKLTFFSETIASENDKEEDSNEQVEVIVVVGDGGGGSGGGWSGGGWSGGGWSGGGGGGEPPDEIDQDSNDNVPEKDLQEIIKNLERIMVTLDELARRPGIPDNLRKEILKSTSWLFSEISVLKNVTTITVLTLDSRLSEMPVELISMLVSAKAISSNARPSYQFLGGLAIAIVTDLLVSYLVEKINEANLTPPTTTIEDTICGIIGIHRFHCNGNRFLEP